MNLVLTNSMGRWIRDIRELFSRSGRRWERDFPGPVDSGDIFYAAFLILLSFVPAVIIAVTLRTDFAHTAERLFSVPSQAVINGFLIAVLIYLGGHLNKVPKDFSVAFKLMLRLMALNPLLGFLLFSKWGAAPAVLIYGVFLIRGVRKTYVIPLRNALLFFGIVYLVFALMQLQNIISPGSMVDFGMDQALRAGPGTAVRHGRH